MKPLKIGNRTVGPSQPCYIIAEAGVNHNGDIKLALKLIEAAAAAGADAVKFQTFIAENLVSPLAPKAVYQLQSTGAETQLEMLRRLELPADSFFQLKNHSQRCGITFLSTPFDEASANLLRSVGMPAWKVASGELTNLALLETLARDGVPIILSTGMASLGDVEQAVSMIEQAGDSPYALLHCTSNYPTDPSDVNLRSMATLAAAFGAPVGYSDHTLGIEVPLAAVALGASVIEKHFTLSRTLPGPDHGASLETDELAAMVTAIRKVESALGSARKRPVAREADVARVARKSLVAACDLEAGRVLQESDVVALRPGTGIPPPLKSIIVGRTLRAEVAKGTLLSFEMLS